MEVRHVYPGEPIPGLPEMVAQFAALLESYDSPLEMCDTAHAFGVRLTSVEEYVADFFAPVGA
jgi:NADH dehydrogenase